MKWLMVFDLPTSQRQIKYYTLCVLCASVVMDFLSCFSLASATILVTKRAHFCQKTAGNLQNLLVKYILKFKFIFNRHLNNRLFFQPILQGTPLQKSYCIYGRHRINDRSHKRHNFCKEFQLVIHIKKSNLLNIQI